MQIPLTQAPLPIPEDGDVPPHPYERNLYLKGRLGEVRAADDENMADHYWIIQQWGGIKNFKNSEKNHEKIRTFHRELNKGRLTRPTFSVISSLSKVASFRHPDQYAIYDSRAVFALNWLLIKHTEDRTLFTQPAGRNKELKDLDLEAFLRLAGVSFDVRNYRTAFHEYCELLTKLSREALDEDTPHKLEMVVVRFDRTRLVPTPFRHRQQHHPEPVFGTKLVQSLIGLA